jgi:hypothetical protein
MSWIEVTPALGRDYTTAKAAKAAWNAGVDWQETATGSYINKSGAERLDLSVVLRYSQNRKVTGTK